MDELQKLKDSLRQAKLDGINNLEFEHALRRALLNSRYYSPRLITRWKKRLYITPKTILWPLGSVSILLVALLYMNTLQEKKSSYEKILSTDIRPVQITQTENSSKYLDPQDILNNWYQSGKIRFQRQTPDGERIYAMELANGQVVELVDRNPMAVTLTASQ